jgi:threonine dehydrogenase-like Zn-dependent dehydrogenase
MKALLVERKLTKFAAARVASAFGAGRGAGLGPLRLSEIDPPRAEREGWYEITPMLSGICGSDLATVDGRSSHYFEDIVSFPFVLGHEMVGTLRTDAVDWRGAPLPAGARVVVQPVLGCEARGLELCEACRGGQVGRCQHLSHGHLKAGLQTGFCADTGGGWSEGPVAVHSSQLFAVPATLSDDDAVTIEPMACALHAALRAQISAGETVAVVGAGTVGLGVVASLSFLIATGRMDAPRHLLVGARYAAQRQMAMRFGADEVVDPGQLPRAVRAATHSLIAGPPEGRSGQLTGGAEVVFDCVGSATSLTESLQLVAPGGRLIVVGMPGKLSVDLAPMWHREISLTGAYAYGTEQLEEGPRSTFELAMELVAHHQTGQLVSAHYPLDRFEEALAHAGAAGSRGAFKIVFDSGPRRASAPRED